MPKAKSKKKTSFSDKMTKSTFLFGYPNKEKLAILEKAESLFTDLVNQDICLLVDRPELTFEILTNAKKAPVMRSLEKDNRKKKGKQYLYNTAFTQNAFDYAVTRLSTRLQNIKNSMYSKSQNIFTSSEVLWAMAVLYEPQEKMLEAMTELQSNKEEPDAFYEECINILTNMRPYEFFVMMQDFHYWYDKFSSGYKIPEVSRADIVLTSKLMTIEKSDNIEAPYVISITNPFVKRARFEVPLYTSTKSMARLKNYKAAAEVSLRVCGKKIKVTWSFKKKIAKPKTSKVKGVDTGITDAFHTSDDAAVGSMTPVIDFYKNTVEPAFGDLNALRNKKKHLLHYVHTHSNLPQDTKKLLLDKVDRLETMIRRCNKPYRLDRRYEQMLNKEVKDSVNQYINSIDKDTLTVIERLDIKEFNTSKKVNGRRAVFARGQLQTHLMEELNWRGYDFTEVDADYTSQACPVCSHVEAANRNGKVFKCKECGYIADADYVGALNIASRAEDQELLDVCAKYKYKPKKKQEHLKMVYASRHEQWLNEQKGSSAA